MIDQRSRLGAFIRGLVRRSFLRDVSTLTIGSLLVAAVSAVQALLVARWLGPAGYGLLALITTYPSVIFNLFNFRSGLAGVKYMSEFSAKGEGAQVLAVAKFGYLLDLGIAGVILILVLLTGRLAEGYIFHTSGRYWLLVAVAAAYVPNAFAETSAAVFASMRQFGRLVRLRSALAIARLLVVIIMVRLLGLGLTGAALAAVIDLALSGIVLGVFAHRALRERWRDSWLSGSWRNLPDLRRELWHFVALTNLTTLLGVAVKQLDLFILGYFRGPSVAGMYQLAKAIASAGAHIIDPLQAAIYPRFAALWGADRPEALAESVRAAAFRVGLPLFGAALLLTPLLPTLIPLLVGPKYLSALPIVQILYLMTALSMATFWVRPWFLATGRVRGWFMLGIANGVFAVVAYPIGAAQAGGVGLAVARFGASLIKTIPAVVQAVRWNRLTALEFSQSEGHIS